MGPCYLDDIRVSAAVSFGCHFGCFAWSATVVEMSETTAGLSGLGMWALELEGS